MKPKISIISLTINESEGVNLCAAQWAMAAYIEKIPFEIIIVDNGSDLEHLKNYEQIKKYSDMPITYLMYPEPGQMIPARIHGLKHSQGDYIVFADSHVQFLPGSFTSSIEMLEKDERLGAVCMLHNGLGMSSLEGEFISGMKKCFEAQFGAKYNSEPLTIFLSGLSGTVVSREWFEKIGGWFPEVFKEIGGGYCADEDLICTLTWMFGKRVMTNPKAVYWHVLYRYGDKGKLKCLTDSVAAAHYIKDGDNPYYYKYIEDHWGKMEEDLVKNRIPKAAGKAWEYVKANSKYKYQDLFDNWEKIKSA